MNAGCQLHLSSPPLGCYPVVALALAGGAHSMHSSNPCAAAPSSRQPQVPHCLPHCPPCWVDGPYPLPCHSPRRCCAAAAAPLAVSSLQLPLLQSESYKRSSTRQRCGPDQLCRTQISTGRPSASCRPAQHRWVTPAARRLWVGVQFSAQAYIRGVASTTGELATSAAMPRHATNRRHRLPLTPISKCLQRLMACMCVCLQAWHWRRSTIFLVVLACTQAHAPAGGWAVGKWRASVADGCTAESHGLAGLAAPEPCGARPPAYCPLHAAAAACHWPAHLPTAKPKPMGQAASACPAHSSC